MSKPTEPIKPYQGMRLKEARAIKGLSLKALSVLAGVSSTTLNKLELEHAGITKEMASILSTHLSVDRDYLLGITPYKNEHDRKMDSVRKYMDSEKSFENYCNDLGITWNEIEYYIKQFPDAEPGLEFCDLPIYEIKINKESYRLTFEQLEYIKADIENYAKYRFKNFCEYSAKQE